MTASSTDRQARRSLDLPSDGAVRWDDVALALRFALQSIWRARRRMVLAVMGVGIGFAAIHTLLIIGHSAEARILASLDSLGGDVVTLSIKRPEPQDGERRARPGQRAAPSGSTAMAPEAVSRPTALHLLRAMPDVQTTATVDRACGGASDNDGLNDLARISLGAQPLLGLATASGRLLHEGDRSQGNIVLGSEAFQSLRRQQPYARLGATVQACGRPLRIVGILQPHLGSDLVPALGINQSALVLGDGDDGASLDDDRRHVLVRLRKGTDSRGAAQQLRERLTALMPDHEVQAAAAWDIIRLRQEQTALYTRFLAVLGGISLLVGAMGIANMMLVSVTERRTEIGLRMAIGARRRDVVLQFVAEGVLICGLGSVLGLLVGVIAARVSLQFAGFDLVFPGSAAVHATLLALACGLAAAAYPAYRAATVDPNQSLRGGAPEG
jgi:putative ABC transport system permease protein